MQSARYFIALLVVMSYPGAFLFWFTVHPLIRYWRKVGAKLTLTLHYAMILGLAGATYAVRRLLLSVEFGNHWALFVLGLALLAAAVIMRRSLSRQLKPRILQGVPELEPEKHGTKLLDEGIYSRIRHPRYAQIMIAMAGYALLTNYLAVYILAIASPLILLLVVQLEEQELRDRFGRQYEDYCVRVPRFIPRRWRIR